MSNSKPIGATPPTGLGAEPVRLVNPTPVARANPCRGEVIRTARLTLLPGTPAMVAAGLAGREQFERTIRCEIAPGLLEYFGYAQVGYMQKLAEMPEPDLVWHGYWVIREEPLPRVVVGLVGFKGPPDEKGEVEIGYGMGPDYQGLGYATEAVTAATLAMARMDGVGVVIAHALAVVNASNRVLEKAGYVRDGEAIDPDDGLVWRWKYAGDG